MVKRHVASLSICLAVSLIALPLRASGQTKTPAETAASAQGAGVAQAAPESVLKKAFAEAVADKHADALTRAEIKKLEKLNLQSTAKSPGTWTKGQKVLVFSIVAGLVALAVVLALTTEKGGHTFCSDDPTDPECLPG
jgi:hypothetical protein